MSEYARKDRLSMQRDHPEGPDTKGYRLTRLQKKRFPPLARSLRWVLVLGGTMLVGIMVFAVVGCGIASSNAVSPVQPSPGTPASFHTVTTTTDDVLSVTLSISPDQAGPNAFQVSVAERRTGTPLTSIDVRLLATILDMDMGTQDVPLSPDGKGHFGATGDFVMGGHFRIDLQIRTPDHKIHEAIVRVSTS